MSANVDDEFMDDFYQGLGVPYDEDSPYCECDLDPTEEECFDMTCACCGKEILP